MNFQDSFSRDFGALKFKKTVMNLGSSETDFYALLVNFLILKGKKY